MNKDDLKAEWLQEAIGAPTRRQTVDLWPCGCCLTEYNKSLESSNGDEFIVTVLCKEHQEEYQKEEER